MMTATLPNDLSETKADHTVLGWLVVLTASLFFFYEFIQMNLFNAINLELMQAFNLNAPQLGQLSSMYFWANTFFLFPAGLLLDRYSTKKLLLFAVVLCTVGTFLFGFAETYLVAAIGRAFVGAGASFCFLSCIRLASRWFPPRRMATVTGVVVTMAMLGGLVAQTPFALLSHWLGWRHAVLIDASIGIFVAIAIAIVVKDFPPGSHEEASAAKTHLQTMGFWKSIFLVLKNKNNWLGGLYTCLMNLPIFIFGLWGMLYLVQVHHLTQLQASYATTALFVGVIFGSPAFGTFSDRIGRRVLPMILGAVVSFIVVFWLMYSSTLSLPTLIFIFFLVGFVTSSQVLSYPTIAELNPPALTSTAVSVDSILIMISGVIVQPLFGWMMELKWDHQMVNGSPVYSPQDFLIAMMIMPAAFLLSIFMAWMIQETYCKAQA